MIPLEVTHTALATKQVIGQICSKGGAFLDLIKEIITYFANSYRETFGFEDPPIHDPCAVAYVIDPHLFEVRPLGPLPTHSLTTLHSRSCCRLIVQSPTLIWPNLQPAQLGKSYYLVLKLCSSGSSS